MGESLENKDNRDIKVIGRDLTSSEEISLRIDTLVDLLHDKNIINKKEYQRILSMRLHEYSKATSFESLEGEL